MGVGSVVMKWILVVSVIKDLKRIAGVKKEKINIAQKW